MHLLVKINYSAPASNMWSQKRALLQNVNLSKIQLQAQEQGETDNILHFFTLPNNLYKPPTVRLMQNNTALYQLQYAGDNVVHKWREVKKEQVRKRKQQELREKAEKMAKLHRLLNGELQ